MKLLGLLLLFSIFLLAPIAVMSQTSNNELTDPTDSTTDDSLGGLIPDDDTVGPVANTDAKYKFDEGFYQKIYNLMDETPQDGDFGVYDGTRYYNVIIVVTRDDGDNRDPDEVAKENKDAIVKRLELIGARDIIAAKSLSFVTASIPIADVPGFSLHDEVYQLGDGELPVEFFVNTARTTIHATPNDLRQAVGTVPDGTGVIVAVIDSGINNIALNSKVLNRIVCTDQDCTGNINQVVGYNRTKGGFWQEPTRSSHGTEVAGVIAATGIAPHNGIATGVGLLDSANFPHGSDRFVSTYVGHGLDWSFIYGADVVNMSLGNLASCQNKKTYTFGLILNEAVDKGMVLAVAAGNANVYPRITYYSNLGDLACTHNVITVGGINDRSLPHSMATFASRGPTSDVAPRLKPEIVAPAVNLMLLGYSGNNVNLEPNSGTSYATPQVSATAAMMLQIEPKFTPAGIKAALLLGANWTGPIPCTSTQYEQNNPTDNCSFARQPSNPNIANNAASLEILNNVGFGILNTAETLRYAHSNSPYIISDYLDNSTTTKQYRFTVSDTAEPVKVILTWLIQPHGDIGEQATRSFAVPMANLDFTVTTPNGQIIRANSIHQTNEFVVFNPTRTGTYTVTVTGSDLGNLNKPVQNFALAATSHLTSTSSSQNNRPIAQSDTIIVEPGKESIVRFAATDSDGDSISFRISQDPAKGIITTDEFITKTISRAIYTPDERFTGTDRFQITPHDGTTSGTPAYITVRAESLPSGSTISIPTSSSNVRDWDTVEVSSGFIQTKYSQTFPGKSYPVSALYLGSVNMEGLDLEITTTNGRTYTMAVPASATKLVEFSSPITIRSTTISADGIEEETPYLIDRRPALLRSLYQIGDYLFNLDDVRMFVGYIPSSSCPTSGASGESSCPIPTYSTIARSDIPIPDRTHSQDTTSAINVPVSGFVSSVSVTLDITHTYIGDLKVILTSPDGTQITLHDRTGGSSNNIMQTYSSGFGTLLNTQMKGDWIISVGDYAGGDVGTLNEWNLDITYRPNAIPLPPSVTIPPVSDIIFSENFESSLTKWTESGEGDWRTSTSQSQLVPTLPEHDTSNLVLHSDNCDSSCTMTLRNSIDLTQYSSATLSFWRFIDSSLDGNEYLKVELYNGHTWNTIYHWSNNLGGVDHRWHNESYDLSSYLGVSNFKMRFVTQQSSSSEDVQIDDVIINTVSGTTPVTPPSSTISEDFESGLGDWTQSGNSNWITRSASPAVPASSSSNDVAYSSNCDSLCTITLETPIDLSSRQSGYLTFDRFVGSGLDSGEYLRIELNDGSSWRTIFDWQASARADDNRWHTESYNLGSRYLVDDLNIRITARSSTSSEIVMIDNILITNNAPSSSISSTNYSLYVADTDDREILVYSKDGTFLDDIVPRRSNGLGKVWDVTFGPDGHMYVSDNTNNKIRKYNGATGAPIGSSSGWASTSGFPYGLVWNSNTLYVATSMGVERFSTSGSALGLFGDATRNSGSNTALISSYDVVFCSDNRMYVADRAAGKILYYTASSGSYIGEIYGTSSNSPNTKAVAGLACNSSLYQSGDDSGRINEINLSSGSQIRTITSNIDEPYGMVSDSAGIIYVVNKDDDNIVKISSGVSSVLTSTGGLDDPRGITIGPQYTAGASGSGDDVIQEIQNDAPEFTLLYNGTALNEPIPIESKVSFTINVTDSENDTVEIGIIPDALPESAISIRTNENGTARVLVDPAGIEQGTYVFWITVSDQDNFEREPYAVIIQ